MAHLKNANLSQVEVYSKTLLAGGGVGGLKQLSEQFSC